MNVGYKKPTVLGRIRDRLLRYRPFSVAFRLFTPNVTFPIHFIVGHYSSGTTILDRLISMHPHCARLHTEGVQLVHFLDTPEDFGSRRNWIKVAEKLKFSLTRDEVKVCESLWNKLSNHNDQTLCMIEKSIVNIIRIDSFCSFLPKSKVIHIYRDSSQIKSSYKRRGLLRTGDDLRELNSQIEATSKYAHSLEANRVHHISYEALMLDPVSELSQIYKFLGLSLPEMEFDGHTLKVADETQGLER